MYVYTFEKNAQHRHVLRQLAPALGPSEQLSTLSTDFRASANADPHIHGHGRYFFMHRKEGVVVMACGVALYFSSEQQLQDDHLS
jgi:hypothetical protein